MTFLQKIFLRPTRRMKKKMKRKIVAYSTSHEKILMPTYSYTPTCLVRTKPSGYVVIAKPLALQM